MKATIVYPGSPQLAGVVQYFLFIANTDPAYDRVHISFPNTNHCLGIHQGNRVIQSSASNYRLQPSNNAHSFLTGIYRRPIKIRSAGVFNQVCINFEPGGLERLTHRPLSKLEFASDVVESHLHKTWRSIYHVAFSAGEPAQRASKIEEFLLELDTASDAWPRVELNRVTCSRACDLPSELHMSYRSVCRFFREHLELSPGEFLGIKRFRRALRRLSNLPSGSGHAEAALDSGFCDQSHMIRAFRKYSNMSPTTFLAHSAWVANEMCWSIR